MVVEIGESIPDEQLPVVGDALYHQQVENVMLSETPGGTIGGTCTVIVTRTVRDHDVPAYRSKLPISLPPDPMGRNAEPVVFPTPTISIDACKPPLNGGRVTRISVGKVWLG